MGISSLVGLLGFIIFLRWALNLLIWAYNMALGAKRDLTAIYGRKSYVVITGGSEGIGLAWARQFAQKGFNLFLVSRSEEKLKAAKEQIVGETPTCTVLTASFDFADITSPENFDLSKAFKFDFSTIDVSILFNNVGIGLPFTMYDCSEADVVKLIKLNCVTQTICTQYFAKIFRKRRQQCAILSTSSLSAVGPVPGFGAYGATKVFNWFLTRAQGNFDDHIDYYCYVPGIIPTRLTKYVQNWSVVDADVDASFGIRNFGSHRRIFSGHWKHELIGWILKTVPACLVPNFSRKKKRQEG